jgi:hypothetical protein
MLSKDDEAFATQPERQAFILTGVAKDYQNSWAEHLSNRKFPTFLLAQDQRQARSDCGSLSE